MFRAVRRFAAVWLCLASALASASHDPFIRGFDAVPVKPTPTQNSGIALEGAQLVQRKSFRFGLLLDANVNILALKLGDEKLGNLIPFRTDLHLLGAYQLHPRLEVGLDLPLTVYQVDNFRLLQDNGFTQPGIAAFGAGDIRVLPRVAILPPESFPIGLAGVLEVRLPTGAERSFLGDNGFVFAPRLAAERAFGPVRVLGNLGYRFRTRHAQFINLFVGHEFAVGGGAIVGLPDVGRLQDVKVIGEMHLTTPTEAPFNFSQADSLKTPWELLVGARARVHKNWGVELTVGRGLGLQSGYGREDFRVMVGLRYESEFHDKDGDGVPDEEDGCPEVPEDPDDFQDSDGCPEPDNDNDQILDKDDGCPNDPGPQEYDGCPDRDLDQIPDNVDKCPDEPGPAETEGCPVQQQVVLKSDRLRIRGSILFETGEAKIQPQSFQLLDEVYQVLKDNPEVGPILIEGHTDNRGSRGYNQDLSERRAKAVVDYLVKKGIPRKRLKSKGYGFDRPVADNSTPLGRAKNRRTEFKLLNEAEEEEKQNATEKPGDAQPAPDAGGKPEQPK